MTSIVAAELIAYSSGAWTAYPDDSATVSTTAYANIGTAISTPTVGGVFGGAIDLTTRVIIAQIAATDTVKWASSGAADARGITIVGRLATGAITSETGTFNATANVFTTSSSTYERILSVTVSAASTANTVTLQRSTGSTQIIVFGGAAPADTTEVRATAMFRNSTIPASGGPTLRYEKFYWKNSNVTPTTLTTAAIVATDPTFHMRHGLAATVNTAGSESLAVPNRITAPVGVSFTAGDASIAVPGGGNIPGLSSIGVWLEESLATADTAFKDTYTSTLSGNTV